MLVAEQAVEIRVLRVQGKGTHRRARGQSLDPHLSDELEHAVAGHANRFQLRFVPALMFEAPPVSCAILGDSKNSLHNSPCPMRSLISTNAK
jgi:hypothetical protein